MSAAIEVLKEKGKWKKKEKIHLVSLVGMDVPQTLASPAFQVPRKKHRRHLRLFR
jgi:hypothetical protein